MSNRTTLQGLFSVVFVGLVLLGVGRLDAESGDPMSGSAPPATVTVPRGEHLTVRFWPNRGWYGNSISGRIVAFGPHDFESSDYQAINLTIVRFEPIGARDRPLPDLTLQELTERLGKDFRVVEKRATPVDETGAFQVANLPAGYYSLRFDWTKVPDGPPAIKVTLEYPERVSTMRPLMVPPVVPAGSGPEG